MHVIHKAHNQRVKSEALAQRSVKTRLIGLIEYIVGLVHNCAVVQQTEEVIACRNAHVIVPYVMLSNELIRLGGSQRIRIANGHHRKRYIV